MNADEMKNQMNDPEDECTSWFAFDDLMKNGTVILHKNRDSDIRQVGCVGQLKGAPRKWIGMGDVIDNNPCMGMNESGFLSVMNSGEYCNDNSTHPDARTTPAILKEILGTCVTAAQAVECLKGFIERNDYFHKVRGSIFFFLDAKEAYIAELTAHFVSVQRFDHGYAYRANIWHNPDMASFTERKIGPFLHSCHREFVVRNELNAFIRAKGFLTLDDCLQLSRNCTVTPESPVQSRVCYERTNSACTMELDLAYPDTLSTLWALLGHPRNTLQIPIPMCVDSLPEKMCNGAWATASYKRAEKLGYFEEIPQTWLDFEKETFARYRESQKKALVLLRNSQKFEAVSILNETASQIWNEAARLLEIAENSPSN